MASTQCGTDSEFGFGDGGGGGGFGGSGFGGGRRRSTGAFASELMGSRPRVGTDRSRSDTLSSEGGAVDPLLMLHRLQRLAARCRISSAASKWLLILRVEFLGSAKHACRRSFA